MTLNMSHLPGSSNYRVTTDPVRNSRGQQETTTNNRGQRCNISLKRHNSSWDMAGEQRAALGEAQRQKPNRSVQGQQLYANQLYGAAYEAHVGRALNRDPRFTGVQSQMMLVPKPTGQPYNDRELIDLNKGSGTSLRSDFIAYKDSAYKNVECKGSNTAGFTANQDKMLDDIYHDGAVVSAPRGNYSRGQDLGAVDTVVVRPSSEDRIFAEQKLTPTAPPAPRPPRPPEDPIYGRRWN